MKVKSKKKSGLPCHFLATLTIELIGLGKKGRKEKYIKT